MLCNALAFLVYLAFPDLRSHVSAEGWLVEDLAALSYLLTAIFGWTMRRGLPASARLDRRWMAFLAFVGLVFFLEEVGYGTSWLPSGALIIGGHPVDGLHDAVEIMAGALSGRGQALMVVITGLVMAGAAVAAGSVWLKYTTGGGPRLRFTLLTFAAILLGVAALIDAHLISVHAHRPHQIAVEELLETNAALLVLLCCIHIYLDAPRDTRSGVSPLPH